MACSEVVNAGPVPNGEPILRWNTRPRQPADRQGELDFGQWHRDTLSNNSYCMDVDKVEYRIGAKGNLRVVGIYELIRWGWQHDLEDIPERLAPYDGKLALLRRISASIAAGQGSPFPTFFVWHRPDLSEFVICRLQDWVDGPRKALGLGARAFASLIKDLPGWDGNPVASPSVSGRE